NTVRSGLSGAGNTNRSVMSRRGSSPGCLRLAALKWFDIGLLPVTEEREQRGVDLLGVGPADVVRAALNRDERAVRNQRWQPGRGRLERQDPVLSAVHDEHGYVDLGDVGAEVGQPRADARVGGEGRGAGRDVE